MSTGWFVYMIKSTDNKLYTGITTDVCRRWTEHSGDSTIKGAKFFRGRKPEFLCYVSQYPSRSEATKQEISIKKLSKLKKIQLLQSDENQALKYQGKLPLEKIENG
ncbi:MAG: GIY-YIG nuclease family protein [Kangiellaceae bacterium]|nr:GIY-YIG nuclease family protein [Kangiellaceae bacterium]